MVSVGIQNAGAPNQRHPPALTGDHSLLQETSARWVAPLLGLMSMDHNDIVERLRSHGNLDVALCNEAADEIESLRQQQDTLRDTVTQLEREIVMERRLSFRNQVAELEQRITELESCLQSHGIPVKSMTGGVAPLKDFEK